ncbi:zona pellucida sperm-binding protein 4 isoform X2 [Lates calcarifer]|uniref:Zona pellucida sperm-binding protein 4 isoform X2 n=1 Tax=Lates calcarifer TaxID=8187 RepID=A0A4W6CSN9_LATCA|nr:zona pellucida sperm-binding protein 4 isoform X2 [Lates calcarifer]
MRTSCSTCHTLESQQPKMETCSTDFVLVAFISLSLLLLKCEAHATSKQFQATTMFNNRSLCHDGFMSVYISKEQFADLPFTIYIQDEHGGYYQATAIAKWCRYFLGEKDTFVIFTVASNGCFVKRQAELCVFYTEASKKGYQPVPRQSFCNKDGFNITIPQNTTVPPLNLDAVWIPSSQSHKCKPKKRSNDSVTFIFPFTDCGAQSMAADGIITYWVNIEVKQHLQKGSIFRDTPFHLTVRCSFTLSQMTQLGIEVQREKIREKTLKSKGILRTEMRFAKDSSYMSFYSSQDPPTVIELGQPVYVEVFVLKHEDADLTLLLEDCWATPTEDPHDPQRWDLLVKGCPFTGDSHRTVVLPVVSSKELTHPSLHKWFVVKLFSFVKSPTSENQIYFHCDIEICKGPDCLQSCSNGRRTLRRITPGPEQRILYSVVSGGPLLYLL